MPVINGAMCLPSGTYKKDVLTFICLFVCLSVLS